MLVGYPYCMDQALRLSCLSCRVGVSVTSAAMNVVSGLLEGLADVDMRFVKVADRECEGASNELKKWFKKLAVRDSRSLHL